ncbi:MAG: MC/SLC25 family protein [Flammeovirgaceae bacterium]
MRSLASNFASLISVTCCYPLEVIKTRMQIQVKHSRFAHFVRLGSPWIKQSQFQVDYTNLRR